MEKNHFVLRKGKEKKCVCVYVCDKFMNIKIMKAVIEERKSKNKSLKWKVMPYNCGNYISKITPR